jgi:hypothetical protein
MHAQTLQGEMEGCKVSITPEARTTRQRASSLQLEWKRVVQATVHVHGGSALMSPERPETRNGANSKVRACACMCDRKCVCVGIYIYIYIYSTGECVCVCICITLYPMSLNAGCVGVGV